MKLDLITNKQDEFYTPKYAVLPLLKYLDKDKTIWCPFDTVDSEFVKVFKENGFKVIHSHIWEEKDFFKYEPKQYDIIISNPPYSLKNEVLERLQQLNKPFAMLMGCVGIFESKRRFSVWKYMEPELIIFDKRIAYFDGKNDKPTLNPPFSSWYFCSGVCINKINFEIINKKEL